MIHISKLLVVNCNKDGWVVSFIPSIYISRINYYYGKYKFHIGLSWLIFLLGITFTVKKDRVKIDDGEVL